MCSSWPISGTHFGRLSLQKASTCGTSPLVASFKAEEKYLLKQAAFSEDSLTTVLLCLTIGGIERFFCLQFKKVAEAFAVGTHGLRQRLSIACEAPFEQCESEAGF